MDRGPCFRWTVSLLGALLLVTTFRVAAADAALGCQDCHGTRDPVDYRPLDGTGREPQTGSFQGNHRAHVASPRAAAECEKCHPGSSAFTSGHRDGKIKLSANLNASALSAQYKNSSSAFLQTPSPSLGVCSNVNCHFEKTTPTWGSSPFVYPADCNGTCHASPPTGGSGGAAGSHDTHALFNPGLQGCRPCHPDHTVEPSPFGHASSVGRGVRIGAGNPLFGPYGRYSGNVKDALPSQGNSFGICTQVYCHSSVQGLTDPTQPPVTFVPPVWGERFTDICGGLNGCHGMGWAHPDDAAVPSFQSRWRPLTTGSHAKHLQYRFTEVGNCMACHYDFSGQGGNCSGCHWSHRGQFVDHIRQSIRVNFDPFICVTSGAGPYSGDAVPGTPYGSCSGLYCHSDGTYVATGTIPGYPPVAWGAGPRSCSSCHGNPPGYPNGAPKANSHQRHAGYSCTSCHASTTTDGSTIGTTRYHVNKAYDVRPSSGIGFSYAFSPSGGTCSAISCHGNGTATWGTTLACDGCHEVPPATASHLKHFGGPVALAGYGDTRIARDVAADASSYLMNCGNCHPVDPARHGNGLIEVELYSPQSPAGSLKALNLPYARYSAGPTRFTDSRGFSYSAGTCSNVYCHSYTEWKTPGGVPPSPDCTSYWPANLEISRVYRQVTWGGASLGCRGCHANPPSSSYPDNDGGAGNSHSWIEQDGYENLHSFNMGFAPISCSYCHNDTVRQPNTWSRNDMDISTLSDVPIANFARHVNGMNDVAFDRSSPFVYYSTSQGNVPMDLNGATYETPTKTCSNVSCHMGETSVKWGTPYRWYNYTECDRCHRESGVCP